MLVTIPTELTPWPLAYEIMMNPPHPSTGSHIIPHRPGYMWTWEDSKGWCLTWAPIPRVYSPPMMHMGIRKVVFSLGSDNIHLFPLVIGKNGCHLKNITRYSGSLYIFFMPEGEVEIWGFEDSPERAREMLENHCLYIKNQFN